MCPRAGLDAVVSWWLVYSCCSHLEHRASVKRFVSLQFFNLRYSVGHLGRVISQSRGRYLTQTQNKHIQTCMLRVGFEPTIPAFERAETVHDLDRAATVICLWMLWKREKSCIEPRHTACTQSLYRLLN
jgi:hypothetical protein